MEMFWSAVVRWRPDRGEGFDPSESNSVLERGGPIGENFLTDLSLTQTCHFLMIQTGPFLTTQTRPFLTTQTRPFLTQTGHAPS